LLHGTVFDAIGALFVVVAVWLLPAMMSVAFFCCVV
jgi:hypothetical protein